MTDDERIARFEAAEIDAAYFHHRDHLHVAWLYLERLPALAAIERFSAGLRRLAAANGKPGLYHETITWAFLLLIQERRERFGCRREAADDSAAAAAAAAGAAADQRGASWEEFAAANPDLLTWRPSILAAYYRDETLGSDLARRTFVMPDRLAG